MESRGQAEQGTFSSGADVDPHPGIVHLGESPFRDSDEKVEKHDEENRLRQHVRLNLLPAVEPTTGQRQEQQHAQSFSRLTFHACHRHCTYTRPFAQASAKPSNVHHSTNRTEH